jgi:hypothetical protein
MGDKILLYYKYIFEKAGSEGKIRLAQMTHVPSVIAAMEPDTPELIERFREAIEEITGQLAPTL